jgi:hypothetical protein
MPLGGSFCLAAKPFVCNADGILAIAPFEPAHYEVRPRHLLEVIDKYVVHRRTAERADNRHRLPGELMRDHHAESGCDLRNEPDQDRRAFCEHAAFGDEARSLPDRFGEHPARRARGHGGGGSEIGLRRPGRRPLGRVIAPLMRAMRPGGIYPAASPESSQAASQLPTLALLAVNLRRSERQAAAWYRRARQGNGTRVGVSVRCGRFLRGFAFPFRSSALAIGL